MSALYNNSDSLESWIPAPYRFSHEEYYAYHQNAEGRFSLQPITADTPRNVYLGFEYDEDEDCFQFSSSKVKISIVVQRTKEVAYPIFQEIGEKVWKFSKSQMEELDSFLDFRDSASLQELLYVVREIDAETVGPDEKKMTDL